MNRKRIALTVMVDLDPIPGWGHTAEDWRRWLQAELLTKGGHYHPVVVIDNPDGAA